jgi:hypothetical protein
MKIRPALKHEHGSRTVYKYIDAKEATDPANKVVVIGTISDSANEEDLVEEAHRTGGFPVGFAYDGEQTFQVLFDPGIGAWVRDREITKQDEHLDVGAIRAALGKALVSATWE